MEIKPIIPPEEYRDKIKIRTWTDRLHPHYLLSGTRFEHDKELIELMLKHNGVCIPGRSKGIDPTLSCDLNCMKCDYSVYRVLELKRLQHENICKSACSREPKGGDEWEISVVRKYPIQPRYCTVHWECSQMIDKSIMDVMFECICEANPRFFKDVKFQYVKILRLDFEKALDVSAYANPILREMALERGCPL